MVFMLRIIIILVLFFTNFTVTMSQSLLTWEDAIRSFTTSDNIDNNYSEESMELLADIAENKINLNQTSQTELEQLPFLTARQIEELVAYTDRYRPIRSLNELMMIESLDHDTRRLLRYFVTIGDTTTVTPSFTSQLKTMLHDGHHTIMATARIPLYKRQGDYNGYLGYPFRHDIRYQFAYHNKMKFGITGAQDAGEPFFAKSNSFGYDHYSYYLQLRHFGRLEALNLGHYRIQVGMGLIINQGFYLGKYAALQTMGRPVHTITAHSSRSSFNYLQGAAGTVRLSQNLNLTSFASYRSLDATLNKDGNSIHTLLKDGYHRTPTEMDKKNNTRETDFGLSFGWQKNAKYVSLNTLYTHLNRCLIPYSVTKSQPTSSSAQHYRLYAPYGTDFFNASLNYGITTYRLSFSGETALDHHAHLAMLHTISFRATEELTLMLLHRFYDKQYTALHARAIGEGSSTQNEHGIYIGATWRPIRSWLVQGYIDYAYFPFLRYQVSAPSNNLDAFCLVRTNIKSSTVEARYRFRIRQHDNDNKSFVINRYEHRSHLSYTQPVSLLSLCTQVDGSIVHSHSYHSLGIMVTQYATCHYRNFLLRANFGWFHSDDFNSRLYQYEPSVLYDFSFPSYYGHGIRYSLLVGITMKYLTLTAKMAVTNYFDRATISTGLQQINGSSQPDLLLQARFRL